MSDIPVNLLFAMLECNPEEGTLRWKRRPATEFKSETISKQWNAKYAGKVAGTAGSGGYIRVRVCKKSMLAHRVIWAMTNGEWPNDNIDHINGITSDNSIQNLRIAAYSVNAKNLKLNKRNTSGFLGVQKRKDCNSWEASIAVDGKRKYLGSYRDIGEAISARKAAELAYGYHENHGRVNDG
ncbi:HNH endonuclease signature motif containing protein [Yersinia rochesterensis]|uniref:HNH endonuclease signature motif containing protein n=1 Tax=Yersinia rochesterensis TaxID=1604335 RepID=UPI0028534F34|nr:HNH endonuclease signature motif containing protein [Yersinia rochesterensis]MDR5020019.1 HNH endonuclease signature motif containing protein [Yersinia rochesterensis]